MRWFGIAACVALAMGGVSATGAVAAPAPAPRLTLDYSGAGPTVSAATWHVSRPVAVRMGYAGVDPDGPKDTRGGRYAGVVIEDARGNLVGGTLFYGSYDKGGNAWPEGIGAHPDLKLKAGTYRLVYFTDAPSRVSFGLIGNGARALTLRSWRSAADYKAIWQAFGPVGNGVITAQQDLPLTLRTGTVVHFWLYHAYIGPGVNEWQLCLLAHARRGTCGTTSSPDFDGGGVTCCEVGAFLTTGVIYGRGYDPGRWDLELTEIQAAAKQEAGLLALVKN